MRIDSVPLPASSAGARLNAGTAPHLASIYRPSRRARYFAVRG